MLLADLLPLFADKAQELRQDFGAEGQARGIEWCGEQLEQALQEQSQRLLNLTEAAALSGYSADHLGRMVREGKIPNAGRPNAPRIRLCDLPKRANAEVAAAADGCQISSATAIVRSVIDQGGR